MKEQRRSRGALVVLSEDKRVKQSIVFQYNPSKVSRTVQRASERSRGGEESVAGVTALPTEVLSMTVQLNAHDQDAALWEVRADALHPVLAALESLMHLSPDGYRELKSGKADGKILLKPRLVPLLLVLGRERVVPVTVKDLSITETGFDGSLAPVTADVQLSLKALTYLDLKDIPPGAGVEPYIEAYLSKKFKAARTFHLRERRRIDDEGGWL